MSKGSERRPLLITPEEFERRWKKAFSSPEEGCVECIQESYPGKVIYIDADFRCRACGTVVVNADATIKRAQSEGEGREP